MVPSRILISHKKIWVTEMHFMYLWKVAWQNCIFMYFLMKKRNFSCDLLVSRISRSNDIRHMTVSGSQVSFTKSWIECRAVSVIFNMDSQWLRIYGRSKPDVVHVLSLSPGPHLGSLSLEHKLALAASAKLNVEAARRGSLYTSLARVTNGGVRFLAVPV